MQRRIGEIITLEQLESGSQAGFVYFLALHLLGEQPAWPLPEVSDQLVQRVQVRVQNIDLDDIHQLEQRAGVEMKDVVVQRKLVSEGLQFADAGEDFVRNHDMLEQLQRHLVLGQQGDRVAQQQVLGDIDEQLALAHQLYHADMAAQIDDDIGGGGRMVEGVARFGLGIAEQQLYRHGIAVSVQYRLMGKTVFLELNGGHGGFALRD
jgi:hypothetical protein